MKIRFDGNERRRAGQDSGLRVRYGPARRAAFRLRWYLILLLVASPVLYFLYSLISDQVSTEVPAMIWYPQHQLLARVPGFVDSVEVEPWDRVTQGDQVVALRSPELTSKLLQVEVDLVDLRQRVAHSRREQQSDLERRIGLLEVNLADLRDHEERLGRLIERGSANQGERIPIRSERGRLEERLAELEGELQSLPEVDAVATWPDTMQIRHAQLQSERAGLEQERALLVKEAELDGVITEQLVEPGQFVNVGTPLLRYSGTRLRIVAYIEPRHLERRIVPGREVTLILPDRTQRAAVVRDTFGAANRLPAELRTGIGDGQSAVPVIVEPEEALPEIWRVDRLPVRVKF
ncbi:HlyD family secretion protein [Thioalkalivibrio sp. ALJ7]|uniref:HlyD family secretion protein n=1 Tax=Thioalkalivibrio sp. ALJ7 TaxID=1158756 RepID=UPI00036E35FA|nr:HlyD family efflux transporter periplasmic adaptor subunit [Thioalkalivibrio sp. ALJ7]